MPLVRVNEKDYEKKEAPTTGPVVPQSDPKVPEAEEIDPDLPPATPESFERKTQPIEMEPSWRDKYGPERARSIRRFGFTQEQIDAIDFAPTEPLEQRTLDVYQGDVNEYDRLAQAVPELSRGNEYDALAAAERDRTKQGLKESVYVATGHEPDRRAKVLTLAKEVNLPPDVVERNFDLINRKRSVASKDYDALVENTPGLAKWLENPDNASVAHDELDKLSEVEKVVQDHGLAWRSLGAFNQGAARLGAGIARIPNIAGAATYWPYNKYQEMTGGQRVQYPVSNPLADWLDARAAEYGSQAPALNDSIFNEVSKGEYARAGSALGYQFLSQLPQLGFTLATGGTMGVGVLGASAAAEKQKELADKGIDPAQATPHAIASGVVEAGSEALGTFRFIKVWGDALVKKAGKQGALEVFKGMWKVMLAGGATEATEEGAAQLANSTMDYTTGSDPDAFKKLPEELFNSTVVGFAMGMGGSGPAATTQAANRIAQERQTTIAQEFYDAIGEKLKETKLKDRSPEAQRDFVANLIQGSPVESVYVSAEAVERFFQSQDESPSEKLAELGVTKEQYDEAKDTGSPIKIDYATWTAKASEEAYNGLAKDIKFDPAALSVNEQKEDHEQAKKELEAVEKESKALTADEKVSESGKKVREDVAAQLKAINEDPAQAILFRGFEVLGRKAGVDPLELYNRYQLRVGRGESPQQALIGAQKFEQRRFVQELSEQTEFPIDNASVELANLDATREGPRSGTALNKHTGWSIDIPSKGVNKAESQIMNDAGPLAIDNLDTLLERAVYFYKEPYLSKKGKKDRNIPWTHHFYVPFIANGKEALARLVIHETQEGKKLYHSLVVEKEGAPPPLASEAPEGAGQSRYKEPLALSIAQLRDEINLARQRFPYFQDGEEGPRAMISLGKNRRVNIDLLKTANKSSFIHEVGHLYVEVMGDLVTDIEKIPEAERSDGQNQIVEDYATLLSWAGAEVGKKVPVESHEKIARGFEKYLFEGKAPTSALQEAFSRFRVWLLHVYKLFGPRAELTPEVRDVMDRLLATEEEINATQLEMNQQPLFSDPKFQGMSIEKTKAYLKAAADAKEHAVQEINQKLMAHHEKVRGQEWKAEKLALMPEIQAEVDQMPIYQTIEKLKEEKLSFASVAEFGKEVAKNLPKGVVATKKSGQGADIELAYQAFGYGSAQEMITALTNAEDKDALVDRLAEEEMGRRFPDLLGSPELSEEVIQVVHNQSRAKMLRMELEHLVSNNMPVFKEAIRRVARRVPTEAAVRAQAEKIIGAKSVHEISPHSYRIAEARAAKEAGILLAKGDIDGAFLAKQKELLNHELFRAATQAVEAVDKALEKFKKIAKADEKLAKSRDMDLVNAARAILGQFGIGRTDKLPDAYLKQIREYDPQTYETVSALVEAATENAGPYETVAFNDFAAMRDAVNAIWDLSKDSREIDIEGKREDAAEARAKVEEQIGKVAGEPEKMGYSKAVTKWEKTKISLLGAKAALTRVEAWVEALDLGNPLGPARKYIWAPVKEATTKYRLRKNEVMKQYLEVLRAWGKDQKAGAIESEELGYTFRDKAELMMAVLHSGNESNLSKLLRGRGWGEVDESGELDRSKWDQFTARLRRDGVLTKADYDFAQSVWNLMDSLKPEAQRAHKRMYGHYFNEITAESFTNEFGAYKGGYIPARVDIYTNEDAAIRQERENFEKNNNSFQFPTTGRGFSKSRVDSYAAPLSLEMSLLGGHIDSVLRFSHIEPAVKQVARMVQNKDFRKSLAALDPTLGRDMLNPWLQRAATQRVVLPAEDGLSKLLDPAASFLRSSVAMQIMVGNVKNAAEQFTGLIVASSKVRPRHLRSAMFSYLAAPSSSAADVSEKSEYMKSVYDTSIYETYQAIDEIIVNPSTFQNMKDFSRRHTYFLQAATQNIVNTITWTAAYDQAVENGADEKQAVKEADAAVRLTQGSNLPEDISRFEAGTATKRLFTQFAGYFNMLFNLKQSEIQKIARTVGLKTGAGKLFYLYNTAFMLPAVVSASIGGLLAGTLFDDDDDDGYQDDLLAKFFGAQFGTATAMIPFLGQTVNAARNRFNDKQWDDRISLSPVISSLEAMAGVPAEVYKAIRDENRGKKTVTKDALLLMGTASGLPIGPLGRPAGYLIDVSEGKANPSGPIDYTRGLVTGAPGAKDD